MQKNLQLVEKNHDLLINTITTHKKHNKKLNMTKLIFTDAIDKLLKYSFYNKI